MNDITFFKMDRPVEHSLLDTGVQAVISRPIDRIDGPRKVSGKATYAAEYQLANMAHGFLVSAKFGRGRINRIDVEAARTMPGVLDVLVDLDTFIRNPQQGAQAEAPEQGVRDVQYYGEPVALVVAETFEQARAAAHEVVIDWQPEPGCFDFEGRLETAEKPSGGFLEAHHNQGDIDAAMAAAEVTVDAVWTTPSQNSAAMELHASIAVWEGDSVTLYGSLQMPAYNRKQLADALDLPLEQVRVVSAYVGGGFGSKLGIASEAVAAAIASRKLGRPVKAVMTRQQVFDATVRRSNTRQRIRLGATPDGRLLAVGHETLCSNLEREDFFEPAGAATHFLYAGEARRITHDIVRMNWLLSGSMRAPGEAAGMLALECAIDELAEKLELDPVDLRKRNDPPVDPETGHRYSTRQFVECLDEAAQRFGWEARNRMPGGRREGEWLIGHGMAAAARSNLLHKSEARVFLTPEGRAVIETDMTDIGTGTYTILAQIAAEILGLPVNRIDVCLGDTRFAPAAGSGGSWGAASSGSSVYLACQSLREKLAEAMGCTAEELVLKDGKAICANRSQPLESLIGSGLSAYGKIEPGSMQKETRQAAYGAHFCEVKVNAVTGEIRVVRWVSRFASGRILNEKTARSQCIGGIIFGIGAALSEELLHDPRNGKIVNRDLAEYHVPVHADVPHLDVEFLPERDPFANPLHAKGLGELSISGAGAAVVNAIYNATGMRVRDYPVTLDKLLPGLPPV